MQVAGLDQYDAFVTGEGNSARKTKASTQLNSLKKFGLWRNRTKHFCGDPVGKVKGK